ncbi:hypothetical protein LguiA_027884 [Lonicera macranthoides]
MRRQYTKLRSLLLITEKKAAKISASRLEDEGSQNNNNRKISKWIRRVEIALYPNRVLGKLEDAYVDMMLCLAANVAHLNNGNVFLAQRKLGYFILGGGDNGTGTIQHGQATRCVRYSRNGYSLDTAG